MSRPKSPERILLDQERAIRKERRELKRREKEIKRTAREAKCVARESYDAKHGGDYGMKLSHCQPNLNCRGCGRSIPEHWMPGRGPVCSDCLPLFDVDGRATPAECPAGSPAMGQKAQLAPSENPLAAPDIGLKGAGYNGRNAQLALFES